MKIKDLDEAVQDTFAKEVKISIIMSAQAETGNKISIKECFANTDTTRYPLQTIRGWVDQNVGSVSKVLEASLKREYVDAFRKAILSAIESGDMVNFQEKRRFLWGKRKWKFEFTVSLLKDAKIRKALSAWKDLMVLYKIEITEI